MKNYSLMQIYVFVENAKNSPDNLIFSQTIYSFSISHNAFSLNQSHFLNQFLNTVLIESVFKGPGAQLHKNVKNCVFQRIYIIKLFFQNCSLFFKTTESF